MFATAMPVETAPAGGRLVAVDGRPLPLRGAYLAADACAGRCRVVLTQRFANPYAEPLEVTYQVPLPADGAVSGYAFTIGERKVEGRVERLADARATFAEAILSGRTAALLEQDRASLFTQKVGNIPPGEEVIVELTVDQPLAWRDGGWEWRFPTVVAPRYLGDATPDAARVAVPVADGEITARVGLCLSIRDARTGAVRSPSHAVTDGDTVVLDGPDARLDRDVVVRWPVAAPVPGVVLDRGRRAGDALAYGALTVVPPTVAQTPVPRDLIVLLDTSGSMGGTPLAQAKLVVSALIEGLEVTDRLELMEFSNQARSWSRGAVAATPGHKADALRWVANLRASGGTEMRTGILAALQPLRAEAQRQVILLTDGLIGFEQEVVAAIRDTLPSGARVHTVGIGSGVNRALTGPAARAGAGLEIIVAPGEDPAPAAAALLARTTSPQVVDLTLGGSALRGQAPRRLPDLFAGSPARLAVALDPHGGELIVRGRTAHGTWEQRIGVPPTPGGTGQPAVVALFGREEVEDLELHRAAGGPTSLDADIEARGLAFGIATRLTAFVAVTTEATVDATAPTRQEQMPHLLAQGLSAEGVGLRAGSAPFGSAGGMVGMAGPGAPPPAPARPRAPVMRSQEAAPPPPPASAPAAPEEMAKRRSRGGLFEKLSEVFRPAPAAPKSETFDGAGRAAPPRKESADAFVADEDDAVAAPADAEAWDAPLEASEGGLRWRGRVMLRRPDLLVIEIPLPGGVDWQPGAWVTVTLADGREVELAVDTVRSTTSGVQAGGTTARLVFRLSAPLPADPVALVLADDTVIDL
ncbi:MAG: VIT domain-containing protein [bacterium]